MNKIKYSIKVFKREGQLKQYPYIEESEIEKIINIISELELYDSISIEKIRGDEFGKD